SNENLPHAIVRFDRAPFSYVPAEPLGDFQVAFDRTPGKNQDCVVAGAAYRFRQSQCVLKSAGKLRCTSCHNPHDIPRGEEAASHYNQVCAGCHPSATQTAVKSASASSTPAHKEGAN